MASAYKRPGSRFWWLKYRDASTGKLVRRSTGLDIALPDSKKKAKREAVLQTAREMAAPRTSERERWETWAGLYLNERYGGTGSHANALKALSHLMAFFQTHEIRTPRQLTYEHAGKFVNWHVATNGVKRNTACLHFVYLRVLMREARKRGFAENDETLGIRNTRAKAKEKNEIPIEHEWFIEWELAKKPKWMREQWLVLMCQGCRVAETAVPLDRIDTTAMTITFKIKGGRMHTALLHPDLLPLVQRARSEGRTHLIEGPPVGSWSPIWSDFFARRNLPYSIHCTRVTAITRLARRGASLLDICNFIGHSEEVNRIYRKLKPPDSRSVLGLLGAAASRPLGNDRP